MKVSYGGSAALKPADETITVNLARKEVTAQVVGSISKTYDGTTAIENVTLEVPKDALVNGDEIQVTATAVYDSPNVGTNIPVHLENVKVTGADAAFYQVTVPEQITGTIVRKPDGGSSGGSSSDSSSGSSSSKPQTPDKGQTEPNLGIVTGPGQDQSQWVQDENGWWLRYPDGNYPKGSRSIVTGGQQNDVRIFYYWERINGAWFAFDEKGYAAVGWIYDSSYQGWFYLDINRGMMRTGWQEIDGKWYYFDHSGTLAVNTVVDGYPVGADGARLD